MSASREQRAAKAATKATTENTSTAGGVELDDDTVREYLKNNDDFLQRHPDMLDYLHVSHASGSAVSLVEKQVAVLRERNMDMRHRLTTLNANARENDRLYEQSSKLVLKLLEAQTLEQLNQTLQDSLCNDIGVDYATLILYGEDEGNGVRIQARDEVSARIGSLFRGHKSVCGTLRKEELGYLFPDAGDSGSAAIAPITAGEPLGLVAVGSSDADRYNSNVGTLFLTHIADVIARLLPRLQAAAG
jgi:uncharacterized protein YigA (DUF484 family)